MSRCAAQRYYQVYIHFRTFLWFIKSKNFRGKKIFPITNAQGCICIPPQSPLEHDRRKWTTICFAHSKKPSVISCQAQNPYTTEYQLSRKSWSIKRAVVHPSCNAEAKRSIVDSRVECLKACTVICKIPEAARQKKLGNPSRPREQS